MDLENVIVKGMAKAAFVCAWADRQNELGKQYPGQDLYNVAPKTPRSAVNWAWKLVGKLEQLNNMSIFALIYYAAKADGMDPYTDNSCITEKYANEFGFYMAMEAMGHGVSWWDDHKHFDLAVPHADFTWLDV